MEDNIWVCIILCLCSMFIWAYMLQRLAYKNNAEFVMSKTKYILSYLGFSLYNMYGQELLAHCMPSHLNTNFINSL